MNFFVHENAAANTAIIHKEDCRYCNGGRQRKREDINKWSGLFHTLTDAYECAYATEQKYIRRCRTCLYEITVRFEP
jgi:hypothetical protein